MKTFSHRSPLFRYGAWLLPSILLYLYLSLFKNALIDDAFITLRYVKTLLASGTWGFFPGVVSNSATSPLNVLLLAIISLVAGPKIEAALWLYFICLLCTAYLLVRLSLHVTGSRRYGWLAICALAFNPLLISTIGLESIILTTLFVLATYCYQVQKWALLAISLALLTLARADGILFFLLFFLFVPDSHTRLELGLVYALCITPWYLFSWIHLGSFLPDTFFIKTEQAAWFQWDFFNGMASLYLSAYPVEIVLSFLYLPLAILLFNKRIREAPALNIIWLSGFVHFLAYSLLRVPPFHWYYVPEVITGILFGVLSLGMLCRNWSRAWQGRAWRAVATLYFLLPVAGILFILGRDGFIIREMPIHSNWGTHEQYREIGLWLKENYGADTIRLEGGEIGTLAYYCDCRLLDRFSDRGWLQEYIDAHISAPGIEPLLWKVNFAFYSSPGFPADAYIMRAYVAEPTRDAEVIKEWRTSTKWIEHGFLTLSRQ